MQQQQQDSRRITKAEMERELELMPTGFENEPTSVDVSDDLSAPLPPALPFSLMRKKASDQDRWLESLDPAAREVLERARKAAPNWPLAGRVNGAVAVPANKIPSARGLSRSA